MTAKRSEGVNRVVFICSILATLGWVIFVADATNGFKRMGNNTWPALIIGIPVTFFIPQVISKVLYWIKDGFGQDKLD